MEYSCKQCLHKSKQNLVFLRRNLSSCPQDVKETYKGLVRLILEYSSPVWDPHGIVVQEEKRFRIVQLGLCLETTTVKLEV